MDRWTIIGLAGLLALGATAEILAPVAGEPVLTAADLVAGGALALAAALAARAGARVSGWLLLGAGAAWFAGTLAAELDAAGAWLLYLHRPILVLAVVAAPGWRPRSAGALAALTVAVIAAVPEVAETGWATAVVAVVVGASALRRPAAWVTAVALAIASVAVLVELSVEGLRALIVAYDAAVAAAALALTAELRAAPGLADRVVEMGERGPLSAALSSALGDPSIEVLGPEAVVDDGRATTRVESDGRVVAVMAHAPDSLADPRVAGAAVAAARLALANAELTGELRTTLADLQASSRRLVVAGETARSGLERRLREGPIARRARIAEELGDAELRARIATARRDLEDLAGGLHPRALDELGLAGAVHALAAKAAVPVKVEAKGSWPAGVEAAAYFVCAEALSNIAKYAAATRASIVIGEEDAALVVQISDDGGGGADPTRGSGLQGLSDRLVALGGSLAVDSPPGHGTRLTGRIPL